MESRHPGFQFEHKFCQIWIYILNVLWPFEFGLQELSKLGFLGMQAFAGSMHAYAALNLHTQATFQRPKTSCFKF